MSEDQPNGYGYNPAPPAKSTPAPILDYNMAKNDYNYDSLAKNHYPSSLKDAGYEYPSKQQGS